MKHIFIINPAAGKGTRLRELRERIRTVCEKRGVDYLTYVTEGVGDAAAFTARKACGGQTIRFYACGGDGTLNEVVNGAADAPNVEFGLIPTGTGNDFHRNFRFGDCFFDIERQLDGRADKIDLLRCNGRYCVNMVNIGFDCDVVKATERIKRYPLMPSGLAYVAGLAECFCGKIGTRFRIDLDSGESFDREMTLFTAANGCFCGGGFRAAPRASLADGRMDLCMIGKVSRLTFLRTVGSYRRGTHFENELLNDVMEYRQSASADITFPRDHLLCVDGETMLARSLRLSVVRNAISFVCPRGAVPLSYIPRKEMPDAPCLPKKRAVSFTGAHSV